MTAVSTLRETWQLLLQFAFLYPLAMSYLWMLGALGFHWRHERREQAGSPPPLLQPAPPVSILIPCFNEGENVEETIAHAVAVDYPEFEVIAINDGSRDSTGPILDALSERYPRLRVVHLAQNQGKAMALQSGALLARSDLLVCIDGDALLDPHCLPWLVRHFQRDRRIAAVTGNPRIRNRTTLLGRIQVGEFSSIVGLIKRAQTLFGALFTVSGVITAFRRSAVHSVGYWSPDMLTEDIDITWKLQRHGWRVVYEPHALVWILMPETLGGLWKQRLRWAMGGAQVLLKNLDLLRRRGHGRLKLLLGELCLTLVWSYLLLGLAVVWLLDRTPLNGPLPSGVELPFLPETGGMALGITCLIQFGLSSWLDGPYDRGLGRNYYWLVWYPIAYWTINVLATIVAFPKVLGRQRGHRARWVSPDRGIRSV